MNKYENARLLAAAATKVFADAQAKYRAGEMSDADFLQVRCAYRAAEAKFDLAYAEAENAVASFARVARCDAAVALAYLEAEQWDAVEALKSYRGDNRYKQSGQMDLLAASGVA